MGFALSAKLLKLMVGALVGTKMAPVKSLLVELKLNPCPPAPPTANMVRGPEPVSFPVVAKVLLP